MLTIVQNTMRNTVAEMQAELNKCRAQRAKLSKHVAKLQKSVGKLTSHIAKVDEGIERYMQQSIDKLKQREHESSRLLNELLDTVANHDGNESEDCTEARSAQKLQMSNRMLQSCVGAIYPSFEDIN